MSMYEASYVDASVSLTILKILKIINILYISMNYSRAP